MATTEMQTGTGNYGATNKDQESQQPLIDNNEGASPSRKKYNFYFYGFIIIIILFLGLLIFTIVYVADNESSSDAAGSDTSPITDFPSTVPSQSPTTSIPTASPTPDPTQSPSTFSPSTSPTTSRPTTSAELLCTTEECVALSSSILSWMNTSHDPCSNFFEYACGGFKEEYRYQLSKYPQWTTEWSNLNVMGERRRNQFLDFLFDEDDPLADRPSIISIKTFFTSCFESEMQDEEIATTQLLQEFIRIVNFTTGDFDDIAWDSQSAQGFQDAMGWLSLRDWNDLFEIDVIEKGIVSQIQAFRFWDDFNATEWMMEMQEVYIPLYQTYFGLNITQSQFIAAQVVEFMAKIANISNLLHLMMIHCLRHKLW